MLVIPQAEHPDLSENSRIFSMVNPWNLHKANGPWRTEGLQRPGANACIGAPSRISTPPAT